MGVAPAWVFSPLELPALPFPLLPGISRWHLWPHNSNAHALCSPVHHLPRDREGKCSDGHPEGHPRGVRISPAFWGVLCLVGASLPLPSVHGGSEATHPMAPVFHGNVSRAVRKLVSSVSVPHHPTSSHRRDHCAPDAALAPSHQPGLCIPHANGVQTMQSCCPITAIALSPATRKARMVFIAARRGVENHPLLPGVMEALAVGHAGPCSPGTQLMVSPAAMSQAEGICVCNLRIFKIKA